MLEAAVGAIAAAAVKRWVGDGELVSGLGELVGKATGKRADTQLGKVFEDRARREAVTAALRGAVEAVMSDPRHQRFIQSGGGFDWGFLELEAADELAKVFIVGDDPDPVMIAQSWAKRWITSGDEHRMAHAVEIAIPGAQTLVEVWGERIAATPLFAATTRDRDQRQQAESLRALTRGQGVARAGSVERFEYLERVIDDHCYLDTAGTGQAGSHGQIPLDEVFVSLTAVEDRQADPAFQAQLDREIYELEEARSTGGLSVEVFEARLDELYRSLRYGPRLETTPDARAGVALGEVAAGNQRIVVLGDPGAGKTTMGRWLVRAHAAALLLGRTEITGEDGEGGWSMPARFPIFVRAGGLVDLPGWQSLSLTEFLVANHRARDYPNPGSLADLFDQELTAGRGLVVLDGMDEIPSADDRRDVAAQVRSFVERWAGPGNRFLVTSRIAGYRAAPITGFAHYQIRDMDRETQVPAFLDRYCTALEHLERPDASTDTLQVNARARVKAITAAIAGTPGIARLATNPLLLTILVLVQRNNTQIPDQRAKAYDAAVAALEEGWRIGQRVDRAALPDRHMLRRILIELAAWTHEHRPAGIFSLDDAVTAVGVEWARQQRPPIQALDDGTWPVTLTSDLEAFISQVAQHNGLLVERAPKRWSFLHQTFQEFYVARHLIEDADPARAIRRRLHNPRYTEPILLALGIASHVDLRRDAAELFDAAILATGPLATDPDFYQPSEYEDLLHRDRAFAYQAAGDNLELTAQTLNHLTTNPLHCPQRHRAALAGTTLGHHIATNLRARATDDSADSSVRRTAARVLGQLGDASVETLGVLRALATDASADSYVRYEAAWALGQLGDASVETLGVLRALATDPSTDSYVRQTAARVLGQFGDAGTAAGVLGALAADASIDSSLRQEVAWALGQFGDASTAAGVLGTLAADASADSYVRQAAAGALGQLGDAGTAAGVLGALVADASIDSYVRQAAAGALGRLGDVSVETLGVLRALAADASADSYVRQAAAGALGQLGDVSVETLGMLRALAADASADSSVRQEAAGVLGRLGDVSVETLGVLRALAADASADSYVRYEAAWASGQLGDASVETLGVLAALAADASADSYVRQEAAWALGQFGDASTAAGVLGALATDASTDSSVRQAAAGALGQLGDAGTAAGVLGALATDASADSYLRLEAVGALGQLGDASVETLRVLRALAGDAFIDSSVRLAAALAFTELTGS